MFLSLSFSLPSSVSKNKYIQTNLKKQDILSHVYESQLALHLLSLHKIDTKYLLSQTVFPGPHA